MPVSLPNHATLPNALNYREWPAHPAVRDSVACLWARTTKGAYGAADRVLPDGCIDIVWDGVSLIVAGPDTHAWPISHPGGGLFAGVRFRTGRARGFLGTPASELLNQRVPADQVLGSGSLHDLVERLESAGSPPAAAEVLQTAVLDRCSEAGRPELFIDALVAALQARTTSPFAQPAAVAVVSRGLGVSEREVLRRCRSAVGYGPKTLDRILRFQHARTLARRHSSVAAVAAEAGYSDQAHLARECRRLAGLTPSDLFKTAASLPP